MERVGVGFGIGRVVECLRFLDVIMEYVLELSGIFWNRVKL